MKKRRSSRYEKIEIHFLEALLKRCPKDILVLKALGDLYTAVGRFDEGLDMDLLLVQCCPYDSEVWYNLGCSHALIGHKDQAFDALYRAIDLGYQDDQWMKDDVDLAAIRNDPRFEILLDRLKGVRE